MVYFVITGKADCRKCAHAIHVAEHLFSYLPRFAFRTILKTEEEWPQWLDQLNSRNGWHEINSPVIWKQAFGTGGKPRLIGGLGEFWEYCDDYYSFQSKMSKTVLESIMVDNALISSARSESRVKVISIIGAANHVMLQLLIQELQNCFNLKTGENMEVKLYDQRIHEAPEKESFLLEIVDGLRDIIKGKPQSVFLVTSLQDAITRCELLIIIDDYSRHPNENVDDWLERCRKSMVLIANDINHFAPRHLKVVLSHHGPVCFNASVLMEYCTGIRLTNIVAVTADEGLSMFSHMADKVDEPTENFWCPPVWGFSGITSYVCSASCALATKVYGPFKRSVKIGTSSSSPEGEVQETDESLVEETENKKAEELKILNRQTVLPKIRAIAILLKRWFAEEINDDIISLGVCSNGSFGFPPGVCFSQSVILNEKRVWQPVRWCPLYPETKKKVAEIILQVEDTLKKFGLGERDILNEIYATL